MKELGSPRRQRSIQRVVAALVAALTILPAAGTIASPIFPVEALGVEPVAPAAGPAAGVQFHAMWMDYSDAQRRLALDRIADAGMEWVRVDFGWSSLQPEGPDGYADWYLERADMVVDEARQRGLKVLLMLWRTPDWANGGRGVIVPPKNPEEFGRIAGWLADHFRGRVSAWEIWNEPNHSSFWKGSVAQYSDLLQAAYPKIKLSDPLSKVVAGSVVYNDVAWLREMYESGGRGYFDVLSTHPYQGVSDEPPEAEDKGNKWRMSHVAAVRDLMVEQGDLHKEIWFTEFGWSSHSLKDGMGNWSRGVGPKDQAKFAVRAFEYVRRHFPYVTQMFWYTDRDRDTGKPQLDNYGLLTRDLRPKPVYDSLERYLNGRRGSLPLSVK